MKITMRENEEYPVNTRVEYAYKPSMTLNGNLINGEVQHRIGFVKKITRTWWGAKRYLICCTNRDTRTIDVVSPKMIFGIFNKPYKRTTNN